MPRRNRPSRSQRGSASAAQINPVAAQRHDSWRGEDYTVRSVAGASAAKEYRCPGCDQVVGIGVAHLVAWPTHDSDARDRRHWHSACWGARERRLPGIQRGRSAPRY